MPESRSIWQVLASPEVLLTIIACAIVAGVALWLGAAWRRRQQARALAEQRTLQESAIQRLLEAMAQDKRSTVADYEAELAAREGRIAALEAEVGRLRDRLSSSGLLGLFGGKQRDVVSALLLENEQLHELLARKQEQLRDLVADLSGKLVARLDEQAAESAKAVRYKQALLSAFLEREETRRLLDDMLARGAVAQPGQLAPSEGEKRSAGGPPAP